MTSGCSSISQMRILGAGMTTFLSNSTEFLRGREDRPDDSRVTGAAAQVAAEPLPHLLFAGLRRAFQQLARSHDEARRAIATLQSAAFHERLLKRMQHAIATEALDGRNR